MDGRSHNIPVISSVDVRDFAVFGSIGTNSAGFFDAGISTVERDDPWWKQSGSGDDIGEEHPTGLTTDWQAFLLSAGGGGKPAAVNRGVSIRARLDLKPWAREKLIPLRVLNR